MQNAKVLFQSTNRRRRISPNLKSDIKSTEIGCQATNKSVITFDIYMVHKRFEIMYIFNQLR